MAIHHQLRSSGDPYFAHETYRHLRTMLVALRRVFALIDRLLAEAQS